jgi:long-subunit fatty acid transport protein
MQNKTLCNLLNKISFSILCILTFTNLSFAQDRHYWDQAIGGKTALLGGIAVGGVRDYSATFYNPGALGFLSKKNMNFNFNMYGIKDFSFINGGGPGIDSRYTRVSLYPASLAGPLPFLGDSLNRFSYMIYSSGYSYVRVSERYEGYADVIPTRPPSQTGFGNSFEGDEYLINQGKIDMLLSEVSVGFGFSKKIADNVGIGFSLIGAYRDQTKIRYESYAAYDSINQHSATSDLYVDIDYWAVRFSGKFGISAEWEDLKLGATITTPSLAIKLASGGTDGASLNSNNVFVSIDSTTNQVTPFDILASDRQEGLPVHYKTPFSISVGIEYKFSDETLVHLAMEWFAPLSTYVVIQPESGKFIQNHVVKIKPLDSAELLKVYDSMNSVFNIGLAVEHKMNDKITGYAAIRTDFSNANYEDIQGLFVGYTDFNIYHFTLGTSTNLNDTNIGVGLEYSHGERSDFPRIFNFPTGVVEPEQIVISDRGTCKAIYNNFNLFFGVTQLL